MKIDRLEASSHKKGRILVFFDNGSLLKITQQELLDFGLRTGDEVTEELLEGLRVAAGRSDVKSAAADMIGRRPMSRRDLEKKLRDKGASEEDAAAAGDWLEDIGALDDRAYAALLVRHCGDLGYGPARMREKLREKGVPRQLWDEALEQAPDTQSQIRSFLEKKLTGGAVSDKEKKRLFDALLRRGFSWSDVKVVWTRMMGEYFED